MTLFFTVILPLYPFFNPTVYSMLPKRNMRRPERRIEKVTIRGSIYPPDRPNGGRIPSAASFSVPTHFLSGEAICYIVYRQPPFMSANTEFLFNGVARAGNKPAARGGKSPTSNTEDSRSITTFRSFTHE